jgi:hypothetical protein
VRVVRPDDGARVGTTVLEQRGTKLELYLEDLQVKVSVDISKTQLASADF